MYSDYAFYTGTYNGALTEAEFERLGVRAMAEINRITSQKAKTAKDGDLELVKLAECAVIDELSYQSLGGSGDVTSESNDGISRSYATGAVSKSSRQRIDAAAFTWLCDTNLLFCGI
jgi:hypothetical protein